MNLVCACFPCLPSKDDADTETNGVEYEWWQCVKFQLTEDYARISGDFLFNGDETLH